MTALSLLSLLSLLAWAWLALAHGRFWQAGPGLLPARPAHTPAVAVIVPARDEAALIRHSIGSLLAQDYAGPLRVVLVDDGSADGTADRVRDLAGPRLELHAGTPRPAGWAGKLWAVEQGIAATDSEWLLLTDADIVHDPRHVASLIARAEQSGAALVSEMVALNCSSAAERALIPAFVYFFQLLYPFAWVNAPRRHTAAAAGGSILVRRATLARIGGIAAIRAALIDDVALAAAVKRAAPIWLGHSMLARSIRPYPQVAEIWRMVARSAYVQLRFSPLLLVVSLVGLALLFVVPPVGALAGQAAGVLAWAVMAATLLPTLHRFGLSAWRAPLLPLVALFYMAATLWAAIDHHRGRGVTWKRRAYTERQA